MFHMWLQVGATGRHTPVKAHQLETNNTLYVKKEKKERPISLGLCPLPQPLHPQSSSLTCLTSLNGPTTGPPQGLCTGWSLFLECSSSRPSSFLLLRPLLKRSLLGAAFPAALPEAPAHSLTVAKPCITPGMAPITIRCLCLPCIPIPQGCQLHESRDTSLWARIWTPRRAKPGCTVAAA